MRELKFRAWDNIKQQMLPSVAHGTKDGRIVVGWDEPEPAYDRVLMQYTGLKDKNGKDIYEGDIIRMPQGVFEIVYDDGRYTIATPEDAEAGGRMVLAYGTMWHPELFEVIGNVHEQPHLLKETP